MHCCLESGCQPNYGECDEHPDDSNDSDDSDDSGDSPTMGKLHGDVSERAVTEDHAVEQVSVSAMEKPKPSRCGINFGRLACTETNGGEWVCCSAKGVCTEMESKECWLGNGCQYMYGACNIFNDMEAMDVDVLQRDTISSNKFTMDENSIVESELHVEDGVVEIKNTTESQSQSGSVLTVREPELPKCGVEYGLLCVQDRWEDWVCCSAKGECTRGDECLLENGCQERYGHCADDNKEEGDGLHKDHTRHQDFIITNKYAMDENATAEAQGLVVDAQPEVELPIALERQAVELAPATTELPQPYYPPIQYCGMTGLGQGQGKKCRSASSHCCGADGM